MIRRFAPADAGPLADLFFDAVRIGAAPKYPAEVLAAWAPERPTAEGFGQRLAGLETFVATDEHGAAGFFSVRGDGYLDLAFVRPDCRGTGVADALHAAVLSWAKGQGLGQLHVEASRMARPFFLRMGWQMVAAQHVERLGQQIENFRMTCPVPNA